MKMIRLVHPLALTLAAAAALSCGGLSGAKPQTGDANPEVAGTNSSARPPGHALTSGEGRFSVTLPPGFPAPEQEGKKFRSVNADRGACMVQYMDMKEASSNSSQRVLEVARDVAMKRQNSTVEKDEKITVQGLPGLSTYASGAQPGGASTLYFRHQYALAGTRLYEVLFVSPRREELDKPDVQAYFDSFRAN